MLWTLEERLWLEGAAGHRALMHPDCVMAFPGAGILRGAAILKGLEGAAPWRRVTLSAQAETRHPGIAVLAYRAEAWRDGAEPWRALCTSVWRQGDSGWQLIQHQQSPV